jgi:hypothetical protein
MNRLSLRNDRLKFETAGILPIVVEEYIEHAPNLIKEHRKMSTCNRLDLQTIFNKRVAGAMVVGEKEPAGS